MASAAALKTVQMQTATTSLQKVFQHKGVQIVSGGWAFFIAENLILSHNRSEIIDRFGEPVYHGFYNTLSSCACLSIAYGYFKHGRRQGPLIFKSIKTVQSPAMRLASLSFSCLGFVGLAQVLPSVRNPMEMLNALSQGQRSGKSLCPMDFESDKAALEKAKNGPTGVSRVTRHGSLWSFALLSFGCGALRTMFAAEFALFTGPLFVVGVLGWHKDYRYRNGIGGEIPPTMDWPFASHIPFAAGIFGQGKVFCTDFLNELKPVNTGVALGMTAALALKRIKGMPI